MICIHGILGYASEGDFVLFLRERLGSYSPDKGVFAYSDEKHDGWMRAYDQERSRAIRAIAMGSGAIYGTRLIHMELTPYRTMEAYRRSFNDGGLPPGVSTSIENGLRVDVWRRGPVA